MAFVFQRPSHLALNTVNGVCLWIWFSTRQGGCLLRKTSHPNPEGPQRGYQNGSMEIETWFWPCGLFYFKCDMFVVCCWWCCRLIYCWGPKIHVCLNENFSQAPSQLHSKTQIKTNNQKNLELFSQMWTFQLNVFNSHLILFWLKIGWLQVYL